MSMLYSRTSQLPEKVKENLPSEAQEIYRVAVNSYWEELSFLPVDEREVAAHTAAWSTVEKKYRKDRSGKWKLLGQ